MNFRFFSLVYNGVCRIHQKKLPISLTGSILVFAINNLYEFNRADDEIICMT